MHLDLFVIFGMDEKVENAKAEKVADHFRGGVLRPNGF